VLLAVVAAQAITPWIQPTFTSIVATLPPLPEVLLRLAFYGPLFGGGVAVTLATGRQLGRISPEAGLLCALAVAVAIPGALAVVLATFNLAYVSQPWRGLALLSASAASTCLLLAAVLTVAPPVPRAAHPAPR
jgi:hypothetical protein